MLQAAAGKKSEVREASDGFGMVRGPGRNAESGTWESEKPGLLEHSFRHVWADKTCPLTDKTCRYPPFLRFLFRLGQPERGWGASGVWGCRGQEPWQEPTTNRGNLISMGPSRNAAPSFGLAEFQEAMLIENWSTNDCSFGGGRRKLEPGLLCSLTWIERSADITPSNGCSSKTRRVLEIWSSLQARMAGLGSGSFAVGFGRNLHGKLLD